MERWRLLRTYGAPPDFNMGLDEALLLEGGETCVLRLYTWAPPALSLGYFQRLADVPAAEEGLRTGRLTVCRRITGGGAIHHENELTFSIAAPASSPLYRGTVAASYERVHASIAAALAEFGIPAAARGERADALRSDRADTGMCFHASTPQDLVWSDAKGVGSAQRRKKGRILHHGSIKLGTTRFEGDIATVEKLSPETTVDSLGEALVKQFAKDFEARFEADVATAREREGARALGPRYLSEEFVRRK